MRGPELPKLYGPARFRYFEPSELEVASIKRAYLEITGYEVPPKARNLLAIAWRIHGRALISHLKELFERERTTHNLIAATFVIPAPDVENVGQ